MLTANKIRKEIYNGNIIIKPYNFNQLNPNSYNVKLSNKLKMYDENCPVLDPNKKNDFYKDIIIPEEGYILMPNRLYLGSIEEYIGTDKYISAIDGRSSIGRLGLSIHATAGFGDIGFKGHYTLEMFCIRPVIVYPGMLIGQVYFEKPEGIIDFLYNGRYQGQVEPTISKYSDKVNKWKYYYNNIAQVKIKKSKK